MRQQQINGTETAMNMEDGMRLLCKSQCEITYNFTQLESSQLFLFDPWFFGCCFCISRSPVLITPKYTNLFVVFVITLDLFITKSVTVDQNTQIHSKILESKRKNTDFSLTQFSGQFLCWFLGLLMSF